MRLFLVPTSAVLALYGGAAVAQPRLEPGQQPDIMARGSAHHTFETLMLAVPGLTVQYRTLPGLEHGPMLPASLGHALHRITEAGK